MKLICKSLIATVYFYLFIFGIETTVYANTEEDIGKKVDEYISRYVKIKQFNGCILIARNGQILVKKGFGMANYEHNIPNEPKIKFRLASLTKQFTAIAILQLEEKGLLDVNDTLSKYIPDYPRSNEIKLYHLLTHTSGIPDHAELDDFNKERRAFHYDIKETISKFKNKQLEFSPGEKFKYSNSGYILLGYIIEKVTGELYEKYIELSILKPLNMNNSGYELFEI